MLGCALLLVFESIFLYAVVSKGVVDTETLHYGVNGAWLGISLSNLLCWFILRLILTGVKS
jgi:hypothetical protein